MVYKALKQFQRGIVAIIKSSVMKLQQVNQTIFYISSKLYY